MPQDNSPIGSVGHLVGASFETAGHYLQSALLDIFAFGFANRFAALIFVVAAVAAILVTVIQGPYRLWTWFLVGPAIFFFMINVRTPSSGPKWTFGSREYSFAPVLQATEDLRHANPVVPNFATDNPASVSWFFAMWDRITSLTTRMLITVVDSFSSSADLSFIAKGERYVQLFYPKANDSNLKYFINLTSVNKCADYYIRMKEYYSPGFSGTQRASLIQELQTEGKKVVVSAGESTALFDWITDLSLWADVDALTGGKRDNFNCDDLWGIGIVAFQRKSTLFIDQIADANRPPELSKAEVMRDLTSKFGQYIVYPPDSIAKLNGDQQLLTVVNEVAARMFVNELQSLRPSLIQAEYGQSSAGQLADLDEGPEEMARTLRLIQYTDQWEEKGDYLMATLALPYVQGFVLYFLSMMFPFFCFCLVIPGRAGGMMLWMGLWLWVKLWDFGFALVMLLDKFLYLLLPHGQPITDDVIRDPSRTIKALLEVDPTYSIYTYYHLLATALAAVPLVTGFVVKRIGGDLMSLVSDQLTGFSGRVGFSMASYHRNLAAQESLRQYSQNDYNALQRGLASLNVNPKIGQMMQERATLIGAAQYYNLAGLSVPGAVAASGAGRLEGLLLTEIGLEGQKALYNMRTSPVNRRLDSISQISYFNSHSNSDLLYPRDALIGKAQAYNNFPGWDQVGTGTVTYRMDREINRFSMVGGNDIMATILGARAWDVATGRLPGTATDPEIEGPATSREYFKAQEAAAEEAYRQRTSQKRW